MTTPVPLGGGKQYHALIIYNHARIRIAETEDTLLARTITEAIDKKLSSWGYNKTYYHDRDALPGRNIFSELFRTIKSSEWIIVVFTKGFLRNCWGQYSQMAAFQELINSSTPTGPGRNFLPVTVDLKHSEIPEPLCIQNLLCIESETWKNNDYEVFSKLKEAMENHLPVTDTSLSQSPLQIVNANQTTSANILANPSETNRDSVSQHTEKILAAPSRTVTPAHTTQSDSGNPLGIASDAAVDDISLDAGTLLNQDRTPQTQGHSEETSVMPIDSNYSSMQSSREDGHLDSRNLEEDFLSVSENRAEETSLKQFSRNNHAQDVVVQNYSSMTNTDDSDRANGRQTTANSSNDQSSTQATYVTDTTQQGQVLEEVQKSRSDVLRAQKVWSNPITSLDSASDGCLKARVTNVPDQSLSNVERIVSNDEENSKSASGEDSKSSKDKSGVQKQILIGICKSMVHTVFSPENLFF